MYICKYTLVKYAIRALSKGQGKAISLFLLWSTMVGGKPKMIFDKHRKASNIPQYQSRSNMNN